MKRISTFALLALAALVAVPAAKAQGQLKAHIPFAFTVANTGLPAGDYAVTSPAQGVVRLVNTENRASAAVVGLKSHAESNGKSVLVFKRYGNQYFLHRILSPTSERYNVDVPLWRLEKRARSGEGILVAMR
jgi:hypothetical protein